jgi:LysM repeat protein/uncharacterized UPF0146 family protein
MRMWTKSACVLLAWSILLTVMAAGLKASACPAQASTRNANSVERVIPTSTLSADTPFMAAASPAARTARYVVQPGDTLSGIAARFGLRGGWQALYAANRPVVGPDPNVIHTGTVLTIPRPAPARVPTPPAARPGHRLHQPPPPSGSQHHRPPVRTRAPAAAGMPAWLTAILLAVGILIGGAFLLELAMAVGRGRRKAAVRAAQVPTVSAGQEPGFGSLVKDRARIVLADHDRLIVTHSTADDTVYVLRPPHEDPKAILRVARLVLAEALYRDLAEYLGLPASWPIIVADYHQLVVTHSTADDTVYVLRPPGEDPKAVLRAARLVLQEEPYEELASQLGVPANWPLE